VEPTLIDTDILIDVTRGIEPSIRLLQTCAEQSQPAISVVTQLELLIGCRNKAELQTIERFIARFEVQLIDPLISSRSIDLIRQYRLSHGLLLADGLIAATALVLNLPLLTKNQRDFQFIEGLHLLSVS
jgi:predicted nucleic acid-binding protein